MNRRIVVLRAGALGDTVLTLPALRLLRRRFPEHRFQAVGYPALWAALGPWVDDRFSVEGGPFSGLLVPPAPAGLGAWLDGVDLLVAWTSRAPTIEPPHPPITHASPFPPPGVHAARWLATSVGGDPEAGDGPPPSLLLTPEERGIALRILEGMGVRRPVVIHPGAGARWKRWPAQTFARLADALRDRGHPVVLVEGPADSETVAEVRAQIRRPVPIIREERLRVLAALLACADPFVGNDSGITHLAAAAGARTIALFGPTDPASWAPLGDVRVLRACTARAVRQGQIRVCDDPECLERIGVDEVLHAVLACQK